MKIFIYVAVIVDVGLFIRSNYCFIKIYWGNCKVIKRRMKWAMAVDGRQVKIWMEVDLSYFTKSPDVCLEVNRHLKDWRQFDRHSNPIPTEWNAAISPIVAICPKSLHANAVAGSCSVRVDSRSSFILWKLFRVHFYLHTVRTTMQNCHK